MSGPGEIALKAYNEAVKNNKGNESKIKTEFWESLKRNGTVFDLNNDGKVGSK